MLGDYVLQTDFLAKTKGENWWHLVVHCFLYTLPFYIHYGMDWRIWVLLYTHIIIDMLKARFKKIDYIEDQFYHISAAVVLYILTPM